MISLTIKEIADIVGGTPVNVDEKKVITQSPEIDSRKVSSENFFIALPGERANGNDFAKEKWKVDNTNLGNIECCETQCKGYN